MGRAGKPHTAHRLFQAVGEILNVRFCQVDRVPLSELVEVSPAMKCPV